MYEFLEYIKKYLEECFATDPDFTPSKRPEILDTYLVGHEPKKTQPEIQVQIMNDSEQINYTTFCGVVAESIPLQFTAYSGNVRIGGVDKNGKQASIILADKTKGYINNLIYGNKDNNILAGRHILTSIPLSMNDAGSIYMTAVRFDFTIQTRV